MVHWLYRPIPFQRGCDLGMSDHWKEGYPCTVVNRSAPTPLLMFYVMKHELDYGMMVTASHNPAIYNGIKVFTYGGRDADEIQTKDIEKWLLEAEKLYTPCHEEDGQMPPPSYTELVKQGIVEEINPMNEYLDNILSVINVDAIRKRDLRVAVDPMVWCQPDGFKHHSGSCKMYGRDH